MLSRERSCFCDACRQQDAGSCINVAYVDKWAAATLVPVSNSQAAASRRMSSNQRQVERIRVGEYIAIAHEDEAYAHYDYFLMKVRCAMHACVHNMHEVNQNCQGYHKACKYVHARSHRIKLEV